MKLFNYKNTFKLLHQHVERHRILMIIASVIITLIALLFTIYWQFDENNVSYFVDYFYLYGNIIFLIISFALTVILVVSIFVKFKTNFLPIFIHIYVFLVIFWGTLVCFMDLRLGLSPIFYLIIFTIVSGLFVVEPLFFTVISLSSFVALLIYALNKDPAYFSGANKVENIISFITYIVVILLVAIEHFGMAVTDFNNESRLLKMTYYDELTGLLNERSYLQEIDELDKKVQNNEIGEYAVILMDLNNIKITNDTYGHRYGCHLIVRCGHTLPQYFTSSKLFHIGGDEFVAIVYGDDYKTLEALLEKYDNELSYSIIEYEGQKLIFSLAHGHAIYEEGMKYREVLQKADDAMYENKKKIKQKYGMKSR